MANDRLSLTAILAGFAGISPAVFFSSDPAISGGASPLDVSEIVRIYVRCGEDPDPCLFLLACFLAGLSS